MPDKTLEERLREAREAEAEEMAHAAALEASKAPAASDAADETPSALAPAPTSDEDDLMRRLNALRQPPATAHAAITPASTPGPTAAGSPPAGLTRGRSNFEEDVPAYERALAESRAQRLEEADVIRQREAELAAADAARIESMREADRKIKKVPAWKQRQMDQARAAAELAAQLEAERAGNARIAPGSGDIVWEAPQTLTERVNTEGAPAAVNSTAARMGMPRAQQLDAQIADTELRIEDAFARHAPVEEIKQMLDHFGSLKEERKRKQGISNRSIFL